LSREGTYAKTLAKRWHLGYFEAGWNLGE
jgi:hypothetical protein